MGEKDSEGAFLELTTRPIKFGPASTANAVFYDEGRREILSVDSNGTITVTSHKAHVKPKTIRFEPTGQIYAIKLSDSGLVATQRSHMSLDIFFKDNSSGIADMSISPSIKQQIISYFWLKNDQLAIITTKSLELVQISVNTSKSKTLSKEDISVAWCKYSPESSVFVISTGQEISAYLYARDCFTKISKLEIPRVSSLKEKAVWIIQIYKTTFICHLIVQNDETRLILHQVKKNSVTEESFMILGSAKDSYTLNVVDNLVVIHNLQLKLTSVFDVRAIPSEHGPSITGSIVSIKGLAPMVPGKPVKSSDTSHEGIYVPQISYFTPNIIVDVRDGKLWELELRLDKIGLLFENDELFFRFLLRRRFHKAVAFDILRSQIKKSEPVERICRIFDQIVSMKPEPTLSQSDILVHVFQPLLVEGLSREELCNMMLLFLRSLDKIGQIGHERLICFLIDCLLKSGQSIVIEQLLQCGIFPSTSNIACALLAHPETQASGLDILKQDKIYIHVAQVLLNKGDIPQALKYHLAELNYDNFKSQKYLDAALKRDDQLFRDIYRHLEVENARILTSSSPKGPFLHIPEEYKQLYISKFGNDDLSNFLSSIQTK